MPLTIVQPDTPPKKTLEEAALGLYGQANDLARAALRMRKAGATVAEARLRHAAEHLRDQAAALIDPLDRVRGWHCPACDLTATDASTPAEAEALAELHDAMAHGGTRTARPTLVVAE